MGSDNDILEPVEIVLPVVKGTDVPLKKKAKKGTILISGAKLHFASAEGVWELVTSA